MTEAPTPRDLSRPEMDLNTLRQKAIESGKVFTKDDTLVHGNYKYLPANLPPAEYGTYSISLINEETPVEAIKRARILLIECMDKRAAEPTYKRVVRMAEELGIKPDEILVLSPGGGVLQEDPEREQALKDQVTYVAAAAPNLTTFIATGHTSDLAEEQSGGCGGAKAFCNGKPIVDALTDTARHDLEEHLHQSGITNPRNKDFEAAATDEILGRHAADVLGDLVNNGNIDIKVWRIEPDEAGQTIREPQVLELNPQGRRLKDIAETVASAH